MIAGGQATLAFALPHAPLRRIRVAEKHSGNFLSLSRLFAQLRTRRAAAGPKRSRSVCPIRLSEQTQKPGSTMPIAAQEKRRTDNLDYPSPPARKGVAFVFAIL
jgi:hypothetical protein